MKQRGRWTSLIGTLGRGLASNLFVSLFFGLLFLFLRLELVKDKVAPVGLDYAPFSHAQLGDFARAFLLHSWLINLHSLVKGSEILLPLSLPGKADEEGKVEERDIYGPFRLADEFHPCLPRGSVALA